MEKIKLGISTCLLGENIRYDGGHKLRLKGTEMAVLSACETGVGGVKNGEGAFGLKRALILSGGKTIVMSLWSVQAKRPRS
ncbi:MAG: CHAT domain-containing protein [Deltaproteobacteria bacterium]|nr:CHAT domain-containing protein [Deltaproteobacteria bacterium]